MILFFKEEYDIILERYKLSSFKYMGHLETKENPSSVYWQPSERDYSKLTEKLRMQKM